jgi:hypothetical protein
VRAITLGGGGGVAPAGAAGSAAAVAVRTGGLSVKAGGGDGGVKAGAATGATAAFASAVCDFSTDFVAGFFSGVPLAVFCGCAAGLAVVFVSGVGFFACSAGLAAGFGSAGAVVSAGAAFAALGGRRMMRCGGSLFSSSSTLQSISTWLRDWRSCC